MSEGPTTAVASHGREATLAGLFAEVCARHADRPAVTLGERTVTYEELQECGQRIAAGLLERGVGPGSIVAICLDRSIEMIAAMLGVVQAGAAYLPLEVRYPCERLAETIGDASPAAVIGERSNGLCGLPSSTLYLEIDTLLAAPCCVPLEHLAGEPEDAAYVIYTSGSTGKPKGVVVTHHNVTRLLSATDAQFHFDENDVWTMFHSFAFDFSVWEIWGCLLHGGRLVIVPYTVSRSPDEFHALLVGERVTVLNQTPSAFALLNAADAAVTVGPLALRVVIFGGEALPPALLSGWFARHGDQKPQMINMYGITETTVHVTYRRMLASDALNERDSLIGEAIADLQIHLLDEDLQPVPAGAEGEICVGGAGVAAGYLNRAELTAERFVADPFSPGGTLYRSGDLARRREDGELVYLGRRDGQVKINGFRIEVGEVEAAILAQPGVQQACVVAIAGEAGTRLAAYFVAAQPIATHDLSAALAKQLPAQMLPAFYTQMPALPLNANGKVDRKALPVPVAGSVGAAAVAPPAGQNGSLAAMEEAISATWRSVLKAEAVSLDENFFDVGGTSLLLIATRTALEQRLSRSIPVTWLFEHTTIRSLARRLAAAKDGATTPGQDTMGLNAQKQRDAFARARAAKATSKSTAPTSTRSIA
jgi:amino acid adenylation domain-containing protein